jgi:hypothetical protein
MIIQSIEADDKTHERKKERWDEVGRAGTGKSEA